MQKIVPFPLRKIKLKLKNNSEIQNEYLNVRNQLDEFAGKYLKKISDFSSTDLWNFRFDSLAAYQSINLVYIENRICLLHNEDPTDRMIRQANLILIDLIPKFIKKYTEKIELFRNKIN